ncbi:MAG: zf-HC2 domain-containing protein, partial [Actinomycetota bacterium]|nr:zf-HC2 domain-containing protein [Actinomycetota bacterium]
MTCAELEELAAELALGTVSGAERAAALDHLAACASCRELVDQLGRVADGMLQLAPVVEPPPGFESKVLARMGVRQAPL